MDFSKNKPLAGKIWLAVVMFITSGIMMSAQTLNVSGRVSDEKGEMLAGIAVYEKGTTNGTLTDDNVLAYGTVEQFFSLGDMGLDLGS